MLPAERLKAVEDAVSIAKVRSLAIGWLGSGPQPVDVSGTRMFEVLCGMESCSRIQGTRATSTFEDEEIPVVRNLVVIGASNVTLALPLLWSGIRQDVTQATRLFVVAGHGRSFGLPSTVFGRTLPSILQSQFWEALEHVVPKDAPLEAVVTDVGNDILYGTSASVLGCWVKECVDRLCRWRVKLTMTELPMASLTRMSSARFTLFRTLLFPRSDLRYQDALGIGAAVNSIVRNVASEANATLIPPAADWYGVDPIHIRRTHRRAAWAQLCPAISDEPVLPPQGPLDCMRLWNLKPAIRWRGKQQYEEEQPAFGDRVAQLWLY